MRYKLILIIVLSCFCVCSQLYAECPGTPADCYVKTGSGPYTYAAIDAGYAAVNASIAAATYGDTVSIPACADGDCVWDTAAGAGTITITKDIKIAGAGRDSTFIINKLTPPGAGQYAYIFNFVPDETARNNIDSLDEDSSNFEITGITFSQDVGTADAYRSAIGINNSNLPVVRRIRIYDNRFRTLSHTLGQGNYAAGVIYHNIFQDARGPKVLGAGAGSWINNRMAVGDANGWYHEDNTHTVTSGTYVPMIISGTNNGGGWVARYNTLTGSGVSGGVFTFESHGNQSAGILGPQKTEIYGNKFSATGYSRFHDARGGKNIVFFNKHEADDVADIRVREEYADFVSGTALDEYLCPDTISTVQVCSDSCICQKTHGSYFFNNRDYTADTLITVEKGSDYACLVAGVAECTAVFGEGYTAPVENDPLELVENREYWQDAASFDGTSGVGCGALTQAQLNSTYPSCTDGVAYWSTSQSCSDLTDYVGANPTTPISGTLYKCAAGTWSVLFTPYTYPHPLRDDGGTPDTIPPVISSPSPSGAQTCTSNPRNVTISVTTNEAATCKYGTSDVAYASLPNTFSTTGSTSHSQTVSNACGSSYTYYVRCQDGSGNPTLTSTAISYSVATAGTTLYLPWRVATP